MGSGGPFSRPKRRHLHGAAGSRHIWLRNTLEHRSGARLCPRIRNFGCQRQVSMRTWGSCNSPTLPVAVTTGTTTWETGQELLEEARARPAIQGSRLQTRSPGKGVPGLIAGDTDTTQLSGRAQI